MVARIPNSSNSPAPPCEHWLAKNASGRMRISPTSSSQPSSAKKS